MNKDEMIEEMKMHMLDFCDNRHNCLYDDDGNIACDTCKARSLYNAGCRIISEDEIVVKKSEYEKIKSLYDTQKGAIMTSSIGDLPLTIEGLRKSVDEMARARNAEGEAQELCEKYYNEAKDLRRELKRAKQETAREIFAKAQREAYFKDGGNYDKDRYLLDMKDLQEILKKYGIKLED